MLAVGLSWQSPRFHPALSKKYVVVKKEVKARRWKGKKKEERRERKGK